MPLKSGPSMPARLLSSTESIGRGNTPAIPSPSKNPPFSEMKPVINYKHNIIARKQQLKTQYLWMGHDLNDAVSGHFSQDNNGSYGGLVLDKIV